MDEKRLEALFAALSLLVQVQQAGHKVSAEINRVVAAVLKEIGV
ncbi:hypothetical protein [Thermoactinomyces daqus]|nr:hypothetical protein [Thermoactinomyces daqus]